MISYLGTESLPIICDKCQHNSSPHNEEQNYIDKSFNIGNVFISSISGTTSAHTVNIKKVGDNFVVKEDKGIIN